MNQLLKYWRFKIFPRIKWSKIFFFIAAHAGRMSPVRPVQVPNCEDRSDPEQDPDVQRDA